jgi:hypothetical protein
MLDRYSGLLRLISVKDTKFSFYLELVVFLFSESVHGRADSEQAAAWKNPSGEG